MDKTLKGVGRAAKKAARKAEWNAAKAKMKARAGRLLKTDAKAKAYELKVKAKAKAAEIKIRAKLRAAQLKAKAKRLARR